MENKRKDYITIVALIVSIIKDIALVLIELYELLVM